MTVKSMGNILVIEFGKGDGMLNEIVDFISLRTQCQVTNLNMNPSSEILSFIGLKVCVHEQTVYRDGKLVPMRHNEFFTLLYWHNIPDGR